MVRGLGLKSLKLRAFEASAICKKKMTAQLLTKPEGRLYSLERITHRSWFALPATDVAALWIFGLQHRP
ncbi:MAG TPA: hypothetical protein VF469_31580 [Kofleriaceae bacterium]